MEYASIMKIEKQIFSLPKIDQLKLVEKIIHHLREDDQIKKRHFSFKLSEMAKDKDIQAEIGNINEEFLVTESDGLE